MRKLLVIFGLAVVVVGGAVLISAIGNAYHSPSHWRALSTDSVL